jgi:formylglycine-generating enzyme required for sulfatase activity/uncharacterized membrane protein YhaH (DUF805 family)
VNWYLEALKKYAVCSGRARRKEHWYFFLFYFIIYIPLVVIDLVTGTYVDAVGAGLLSGIYIMALFIPSIAVGVRRMHDTDHSGWWLLLPLVNLVFLVLDSQQGENRFGSNPKATMARTEARKEANVKLAETSPITNVPPTTATVFASGKATPSNLATVMQDKAELEKSVDRYVAELKGRGIVNVQDFSYSGSLPNAETKSLDKSLSSDETFYEKAFNELESADRKVGLWAKVFAEAQGNESLAKASYLKIRSGQLANEHKQVLLEEERQRQEKEKIAGMERRRQAMERQRKEKMTEMERAQTFTSPTLGAKFVLIPAGTFMMGSPASEEERSISETQHQVTISKPFYMQTTPVTQEQWKRVMGHNPAFFTSWFTKDDDHPVERVSWNDVQEFIGKFNELDGTDKYRLPTEAQWEYAARAGTTTMFNTGNSEEDLSRAGWYHKNSGKQTQQVGEKTPNAWGLYDMHGNVLEWCQDWKGDYSASSVTDPEGPSSGSYRIVRGGAYCYGPILCRSAYRNDAAPSHYSPDMGFRLIRTR